MCPVRPLPSVRSVRVHSLPAAPPRQVRIGIEREHTGHADADAFFVSSNWAVRTTPRIEWWFVVEPTPQKLIDLSRRAEAYSGLRTWPVRERPPASQQ